MAEMMEEGSYTPNDIREKMHSVKVIVSDIEGTTTSIPFVRSILKSYCKENLNKYIKGHWGDAELLDIRSEMETKSTGDKGDSSISSLAVEKCESSPSPEKALVEQYILHNLDSKQASFCLKSLQTKIWEEGYVTGKMKGQLFPDVIPAFKKWNEIGLHIYMYSSSIELAQKLLFMHSLEGDVHELISGFFDLNIGSKVDSESYKKIMEKVDCPPENAVFLSDNVQELAAAKKAGMIAVLVCREGNESVDVKYRKLFPTVYSFEEITFLLSKRKLSSSDESHQDIVRKKARVESEGAISKD